jgi:hypothetical protein
MVGSLQSFQESAGLLDSDGPRVLGFLRQLLGELLTLLQGHAGGILPILTPTTLTNEAPGTKTLLDILIYLHRVWRVVVKQKFCFGRNVPDKGTMTVADTRMIDFGGREPNACCREQISIGFMMG